MLVFLAGLYMILEDQTQLFRHGGNPVAIIWDLQTGWGLTCLFVQYMDWFINMLHGDCRSYFLSGPLLQGNISAQLGVPHNKPAANLYLLSYHSCLLGNPLRMGIHCIDGNLR